MKKIFLASLFLVPAFSLVKVSAYDGVTPQNQKDICAANNGKSNGDGSKQNPYDVQTAISKATPGTKITLLNGTYELSSRIFITDVSGTEKNRITLKAEEAGKVVFDFTTMFDSELEVGGYKKKYNTSTELMEGDALCRGIQLNSSYWDVYGITIKNAGDNGIYIGGSYNTVERCVTTGCRDTGIQLGRIGGDYINISSWPSYNTILNCTSYNNDDYTGEDADGFACKLTTGVGNVFDGCISYNNSDDGWDLYTKNSGTNDDIMIGSVTIKNCIAFNHGRTTDGSSKSAGDGNGFKLGGEKINGNHIIENSLSFNNTCHGFTDNSNPGTITVKNCTSYNNGISPEETKSNFDFARFNYASDNNASGLTSNNYLVNDLSFSEVIKNKNINNEMVDVMAIPDKYVGTAQNSLFSRYGFLFKFTDAAKCDYKDAALRGENINQVLTGTDIFETTTLPWTKEELEAKPDLVDEMWRDADGSVNVGNFLKVKDSFLQTVGMTNIGINLHK